MRKMKDSGVEWIGEIPEKWSVWKMKHLASEPMQYGANATGVEYSESLPRYVRITDITTNRTLSNEGKQSLPTEIAEEYILDDGDILFARSGATAGKSFYYESKYGDCAFAGYLIRFKADFQKANSKFLYYYTLTQAYEEWSQQIFIQATIQNISAEKYNGLRFAIPDNIEQQNEIVEYLDKKCAEIDALIDAKEKTNALLKEQRQSIIYEAVTKGLNPDVPMKDSGSEWIGEIPESWDICKLKYVVELRTEKTTNRADSSQYIGLEHIESVFGRPIQEYTAITDFEGDTLNFYKGDVLFGKLRPYLSKAWIATCSGKCSSEFWVMKPNKVNGKYLFYTALSNHFIANIDHSTYGVKMPRAKWNYAGNQKICLPEPDEQSIISEYLDKKCAEIDALIEANNTTIEKLKEYRKSVIFEAVTGKVEV